MNTFARILLLVVSGFLIAYSLPVIINTFQAMNEAGWTDISTYGDKFQAIISISSQILNCFSGLIGVICALRGRSSFILGVLAAVMVGMVVAFFVKANENGTLGDWKNILQTAFGFALPILYGVGAIILIIFPKD